MSKRYIWTKLDCEQTKEKLLKIFGSEILRDFDDLKNFKKNIKYFQYKYDLSKYSLDIIIGNLYDESKKLDAFSIFQKCDKKLKKNIDDVKQKLKDYYETTIQKYEIKFDEFLKLITTDYPKEEPLKIVTKEEPIIEGSSKPKVGLSIFNYNPNFDKNVLQEDISDKDKVDLLIYEKCKEFNYNIVKIRNSVFSINNINVSLRSNFGDLSYRYTDPNNQTFGFSIGSGKYIKEAKFVIFYIKLRNEFHIVPIEDLKNQTNICFGYTKKKTKNLVPFDKFKDAWYLLSPDNIQEQDHKKINSKIVTFIGKNSTKKSENVLTKLSTKIESLVTEVDELKKAISQ